MYEKSIVLLKNGQLAHVVKSVVTNRQKECDQDLHFLCDFEKVRQDVSQNRKTAPIRQQLTQFIGKHGFPFVMVMDFRADLGLPHQMDPEQTMLFKTFLLTFAVLGANPKYKSKVFNLVCIGNEEDKEKLDEFRGDPGLMLKSIRTSDEKTNTFLNSMAAKADEIRHYFNMNYIISDGTDSFTDEVRALEELFHKIEGHVNHVKSNGVGAENAAGNLINENLPAAIVICRASPEKIIYDGEIRDVQPDEAGKYQEGQVYLLGSMLHNRINEVQKKLIQVFDLVLKVKPFKKDKPVIMVIPDTSSVDGQFSMNMGVFLSNSLSRNYKIRIDMGKVNHDKVKSSAGFIAFKDFLGREL